MKNPLQIFTNSWMDRLLNTAFLSKLKVLFGKTYWQKKILTSDATVAAVDIPELGFPLVIGKTYRISVTAKLNYTTSATSTIILRLHDNVKTVLQLRFTSVSTVAQGYVLGGSMVFTAQSTTLIARVDSASASAYIIGDGTEVGTFAILEELPNHEETTF